LARVPDKARNAGEDASVSADVGATGLTGGAGARPPGGRVIVRIVDRGPGIPPAQLERVFEPFYRAGTSSSGHRGSGLGLAIARGFTQASSGSLYVESLPGQGASFVFELPLRDPASSAVEPAGDGGRAESSSGRAAASGNAPAVAGAPGKSRHERTSGA
jgi:signal transduction histidine kinase